MSQVGTMVIPKSPANAFGDQVALACPYAKQRVIIGRYRVVAGTYSVPFAVYVSTEMGKNGVEFNMSDSANYFNEVVEGPCTLYLSVYSIVTLDSICAYMIFEESP